MIGWFEFEKLPERYWLLIPKRVIYKLKLYKYCDTGLMHKKVASIDSINQQEKKFFRYFMKQSLPKNTNIFYIPHAISELIKRYAENHSCSKNLLEWYINKWENIGFFDAKHNIILYKEMPLRYHYVIPKRVMSKYLYYNYKIDKNNLSSK